MTSSSNLARQAPFDPAFAPSILDGYSIEITAKDAEALKQASHLLAPGTAVSIAFLPDETMESRVVAAATVRRAGFDPVPHVSARRLKSVPELDDFLRGLANEAGVSRVFVVAGDTDKPEGPYGDSLDLIRSGLLQKHGIRKVGIAGYPEGHPQISDDRLWNALREKQQLLTQADFDFDFDLTTQFSFDPRPVLNWTERLRAEGISAPVRIGVPGPASVKTLLRFAARCGVAASARVMAKYGLSLGKLLTTAGPDRLIAEFEDGLEASRHGEIRLHFYPFGGLAKTAEWIRDFRDRRA